MASHTTWLEDGLIINSAMTGQLTPDELRAMIDDEGSLGIRVEAPVCGGEL